MNIPRVLWSALLSVGALGCGSGEPVEAHGNGGIGGAIRVKCEAGRTQYCLGEARCFGIQKCGDDLYFEACACPSNGQQALTSVGGMSAGGSPTSGPIVSGGMGGAGGRGSVGGAGGVTSSGGAGGMGWVGAAGGVTSSGGVGGESRQMGGGTGGETVSEAVVSGGTAPLERVDVKAFGWRELGILPTDPSIESGAIASTFKDLYEVRIALTLFPGHGEPSEYSVRYWGVTDDPGYSYYKPGLGCEGSDCVKMNSWLGYQWSDAGKSALVEYTTAKGTGSVSWCNFGKLCPKKNCVELQIGTWWEGGTPPDLGLPESVMTVRFALAVRSPPVPQFSGPALDWSFVGVSSAVPESFDGWCPGCYTFALPPKDVLKTAEAPAPRITVYRRGVLLAGQEGPWGY